ncbi:MAG: PASTA domain-containing protein [Acidobacteriota bacterium]
MGTAGRLVVLAVALAITYGTFFLTAMRVANRAREVAVPDLRGRSVSEANDALLATGLILKVDGRRADPKVPAEHVLTQEPEPGAVLRRQRNVRVRVSDGTRNPEVPSVIGQMERTAEIVLAQEGVTIESRAEVRLIGYPTGAVVAQDPAPKGRGARVALLINRGDSAESFVMPDVIGLMGVRVVDILRRRGFRVTVADEVPYPGLPTGIVVRQTPRAGFRIGAEEPVQLEVSR